MARTHFVRILDKDQIRTLRGQLEVAAGRKFPLALSKGHFEIKAPDGDVVFAGLQKSAQSDLFVCRLHREVFDEAASA